MKTEAALRRDEIHARIARLRRRIDRHAGRMADRSLLLVSWPRFVRKHPGRALMAAAGLGMALSSVISKLTTPGDERVKEPPDA